MLGDFFRNTFLNRGRYKAASEAVIISCFYNPENSPYRLLAFQKFYHSIKHLNHRIIECVIGDGKPQLPDSEFITRIYTDTLLWHKEALLNRVIADLPLEFDYVFWVDADVLFTNDNWLVEAVDILIDKQIVQVFEYCVHLEKKQTHPSFDVDAYRATVMHPSQRHPNLWRSFAANYVTTDYSGDQNYDRHGHVGFAWGARRSLLAAIPLYDKALIGGADHIMAHAAANQIPHPCITKAFTDDLEGVNLWSKLFATAVQGEIGYVKGDLYHLWHGDLEKRQYLKRIRDFIPQSRSLTQRDSNGLYVQSNNAYMRNYYQQREVQSYDDDFSDFDDGFAVDMGYALADMIVTFVQHAANNPAPAYDPPTASDFTQSNGGGVMIMQEVLNTPVEASYQSAPDADSTPVEASHAPAPDVDRTPVEASYDAAPSVDSTPVESSGDSGNFS